MLRPVASYTSEVTRKNRVKIFLSFPKAKHHESFEIQEPDSVEDIQRFLAIAVKKKNAMNKLGLSCAKLKSA